MNHVGPNRPLSLFRLGASLALLLLAAAIACLALPERTDAPIEREQPPLGDAIRAGTVPIPPLTDATKAQLAASRGFQALVSYTDLGFEPREIAIRRGDTVRFTNNSSHDVWIAASGERIKIYPRTSGTCGPSALDSCAPFPPQDVWEFTFEIAGEWEVVSSLDKSRSGHVLVE